MWQNSDCDSSDSLTVVTKKTFYTKKNFKIMQSFFNQKISQKTQKLKF